MTCAVDPMRRAVFDHLSLPQGVRDSLSRGVTWGGWRVPTAVELSIVVALGLAMLSVAIAQFRRTE